MNVQKLIILCLEINLQQQQMKKATSKHKRYIKFEGYLGKLSTIPGIGFQTRYWKIFENGTKLGYANEKDGVVKPQKIFFIKQCHASENVDGDKFELCISNKMLILKASNEEERNDWIKALSYLKRQANKQKKLKQIQNLSQTTIAPLGEKQKTKNKSKRKRNISKVETATSIKADKPKVFQPEVFQNPIPIATDQQLIQQLLKSMPQKYLKYNTLLTHLKSKSQGIFIDTYSTDRYLLISSKSLYPEIYIDEQNLDNTNLPPWIEINIFYKILDKNKKKNIFEVNKIIDVTENHHNNLGLKVNMGEIIYQFFANTVQQKQCLKNCLQIATVNAEQVNINGKMSKKNFDRLLKLHEIKLPQFESQIKKKIVQFLGGQNEKKQFNLSSLFSFMDASMMYLHQVIQVISNKKKNYDNVILQILKQFHEEIKTQTKLTWDSTYVGIKGIDILNILKKLSEYYQFMKQYIKSAEFLEGMKELSKVYVRDCWKNFESIIVGIVQQQKNGNILQDEFCDYIQTNGVVDLFKFIYNVFNLAYPHWKNKIHLHNVNKLTQKALQVFVNELRSTIDEEELKDEVLVGIANNYFAFKDYIKEFYHEKFEEQLKQKTEEAYDKIIDNYREVSMIVLEKIVANIGYSIEQYCNKCTIQTIKCQTIQQIISKSTIALQKNLHIAFLNKLYEKISLQIHKKICLILMDQLKKKKLKIKENIRCIAQLKNNLLKIFQNLNKSSMLINKKLQQIYKILSCDLYSDIQAIIASNNQPIKTYYLKLLQLRQDYREGSPLHKMMNNAQIKQPELKRLATKDQNKNNYDNIIREKNDTMSKNYFEEEIASSQDNGAENQQDNANGKLFTDKEKLISEGYLTKGKKSQKVWEKQYFRLKKQFIYIYPSEDSDRCRNAIEIKKIVKIDVLNPEKPNFLLTYKNLKMGEEKQIKLKADSIQERERWVNSIELERKRLKNEEHVKTKAIKHRQTSCAGKRKYKMMIIDYWQLENDKDYFSYGN